MPRLVRRAPLYERIQSYLDPSDWLIWISEELNSPDWDDFASSYATYIGFTANLLFVIAQANSGPSNKYDIDSVFKEVSGPGWMTWTMNLLVLVLGGASMANAWFVWAKRKHYRMFEQNVEVALQTPSARRVRVDSSPSGASPLSFIKNALGNSAASRAHPDAERDVWEIAIWDPNPLCLELFCLFSPLHVVLYYFNLPVAPLDPRPSVKVTATIFIGAILSLHLWWLRSAFTQQIKDNAIITRGVMQEYNSKFVHPSLQKQCRDVGIQTISKNHNRDSSVGVRGNSSDLASEVVTYTPTTIINRTFRTNPNTNYASQYDPDNLASAPASASVVRSSQQTPSLRPAYTSQYTSTSTASGADFSSPIRPSNTPNPFRQAPSIPRTSDGGYLGVKTHAASPLRKSQSTSFIRDNDRSRVGRASFGAYGQPLDSSVSRTHDGTSEREQASANKREGSPLKRMSMTNGDRPLGQADRLGRNTSYGGGGLGSGRRESSRRESGRF